MSLDYNPALGAVLPDGAAVKKSDMRNALTQVEKAIDAETDNRVAGDAILQGRITDEAAARAAAVDAERDARITGDGILQGLITDEAQARASADDAEAQARISGDEAQKQARIDGDTALSDRITRTDDRTAGILATGSSNDDYPFSVADDAGRQLMGFSSLRQMLDLGFALGWGDGRPWVSTHDADYVFSVEDEAGNPVFALGGNAQAPAATPAQSGDVEGFAAKRAANEVPVLDDDDQTGVRKVTAAREVYVGVPFVGQSFSLSETGAGVDVGYLPHSGSVNIILNHDDAYVRSDIGFLGRTGNTVKRSPGVYTVIRAFRLDPRIVCEVVIGSVEETTTTPIRSRSIAFGGQSHIQSGFRQGLVGGLLDGLAGQKWSIAGPWLPTPLEWTPHCINGAMGETAVSSASKPVGSSSYWWHRENQTDGPALTTWKTVVSAAVAAGQPVPEDVVWAQGEGDTESLSTGELTLANHWTDLTALFAAMRAFLVGLGAADPRFYIGMLGRGEQAALQAKAVGYNAVRQNYLRLISETAGVHYACELYDLPGALNDIHYSYLGHYTHGYRYSRAIANVRAGQSNSLGPLLVSATLENGGRSARLKFSGTNLRAPSSPAAPAIMPVGGNAQSPSVRVTGVKMDGSDMIVSSDTDLTGCRILYPSGAVPNPRGDSIIYDLAHSHVKMPGLPLRSFISNPLA